MDMQEVKSSLHVLMFIRYCSVTSISFRKSKLRIADSLEVDSKNI